MKKNEEDKFDEMFQIENEQFNTDKTFFKRMKNKLYKKIFLKIIMFICIASLVIGGGMFTISKLEDMYHLTPDGLSFEIKKNEDAREGSYTMQPIELFLRCYYKMMIPGVEVYFQQESGETFKSEGFATYSTKVYAGIEGYGNEANYIDGTLRIDHSYLNLDDSLIRILSYSTSGEFKNYNNEQDKNLKEHDEIEMIKKITDIEELPQSAVIDVSITFNEKKPLAIIDELHSSYPNSIFRWAAVGWIIDSDGFLGSCYGIPLQPQYFSNGKNIEKYPNIYLLEADSEGLEIYYHSVLQMMKDNEDYYEMMANSFPYYSQDLLDRQIKEAEDGVNIIGVQTSMKKGDLLDMIDKGLIDYLTIHDIRLSEYSK